MASSFTPPVQGTGLRATVQRFGGYLAGMVMPNIAAIIAWGLITTLFIPDGWFPNKDLAVVVGPMIMTLLPVLIGFTGGKLVHGTRGGVVGAVATFGVTVGADQPMFLGAMIAGPLTAYLMKLIDGLFKDKVKPGFEMLIDNFTGGILAGTMALIGLKGISPVMGWLTDRAEQGVDWMVSNHLLGLVSILVEPGKVLFLNNAINHGVFTPLGVAQVEENGKSILFMIESNPGPGLGLLLAFMLFGPRSLRPSTPAAIVIHFFGGIHEIYFPYILMKPKLILATIAGGATGVATFMVTGAGLRAAPSPGSIVAYLLQTPKGGYFGVLLGVTLATAASFAVASVLMGFGKFEKEDAEDDAMAAAER